MWRSTRRGLPGLPHLPDLPLGREFPDLFQGFQGKLHRPKLATKRVEDQTEAFNRRRAEPGIVALLANDDHGVTSSSLVFERRGGKTAPDDFSVRKDELARGMGLDAELS